MGTEYLLQAVHLTRTYHPRRRFLQRSAPSVTAVNSVTLAVRPGSILAIAGGSGAGKSTLARCLACLERPDDGDLFFEGRNVLRLPLPILRQVRRQIQMVPQSSAASLNPSFTALETVREPLDIAAHLSRRDRNREALAAMERVGLCRTTARRRSDEFSGGQRQRLALARALTISPRVLILDESLAGLDVAVRAEIVNLLLVLQRQFGLTYILISHDQDLTTEIADETLVMENGRILQDSSPDGEAGC